MHTLLQMKDVAGRRKSGAGIPQCDIHIKRGIRADEKRET